MGCAVKVARIATGEIEDTIKPTSDGQSLGGQAYARKLSAKRRSEIAQQAAQARWAAKGAR